MKLIKILGVTALLLFVAGLAVNEWSDPWSTVVYGRVAHDPVAQPNQAATSDAAPLAAWDLRVSGPYVHKNLEVYLVHGSDQVPDGREILTLEEAIEQKKAIVHETDQVRALAVENLTADVDVYVQAGDLVQGGKQDRVLA
ncbi:MAG: ARPP-1 family domain-containing protein, partial [Planctomycetota bacterium]